MEYSHLFYAIPHISVRLEMIRDKSRPKFIIDGKHLVAEKAAKQYLRNQGWWVVAGAEISLFFSMLSANFGNSFFAEVCKNYVGDDAIDLIQKLDSLCLASIARGRIDAEHLSNAVSLMCRYYKGDSDHSRARQFGRKIEELSPSHQIAILNLYREIGYFTKGIPDLFATKEAEFVYFEVKSEGDALRAEQYVFAETLLPKLPHSFQVLRLLGKDGTPHQLANPADGNR